MVLGMLPLSALAVWMKDGSPIAITSKGTAEVDGHTYYTFTFGDSDNTLYYTLKNPGAETYQKGDKLDYYTYDQLKNKGTPSSLEWGEAGEPITVTFNWNYGNGEPTVLTVDENGNVTAPTAPTREGYKFIGWSTDPKATAADFDVTKPFTQNTTLYAVWVKVIFTITLDANGGMLADGKTSGTVTTNAQGKLDEMPDDPTREGCTFKEWNTKADGSGTSVTTDHEFKEDATIYAQWVVEIKAAPDVKASGLAESTVSVPDDEEWINNAKANNVPIVINARAGADKTALVKSAKVTIDQADMERLVQTGMAVEIDTDRANVYLPAGNVAKLSGKVELDIGENKNASNVKVPAGGSAQTSVEISLSINGSKAATQKGNGLGLKINIYLKVDLTIDEGYEAAGWYKPRTGALERLTDSVGYDRGIFHWTTDHFSEYVFGEVKKDTSGGTGDNGGSTSPNNSGAASGGGSSSSGYAVNVGKTTNGSISVSPSKAEKGATVTITVRPNKGYELDKLTVKDADGNTIRVTNAGDNKYTFIMPDGKVEIEATFKAVVTEDTPAAAPSFSDVPSGFWAYDQIVWAAEKGIMNGYGNGVFGPDRNTTRQALWMVLGRLDGSDPSGMTAARSWSMGNGVSDGTNPSGSMSRQQMVTMLYRYAQMKGYATTGSANISSYPDSGSVANYAQDALSWAVANGIMTGTTDGRLNPTGTASRAHFAVFMYRFCNLYNIA